MNQDSIQIVQLTDFLSSDADAMRELISQLGNNFQPFTDEALKEIIKNPYAYLWIARDTTNQRIVGMLTQITYRIPYTIKSYLDDLVVDEAYRGQKIGSRLLENAITQAKEAGSSYVEFTSNPKRIAGNKLYEKMGFKKREANIYRLIF